MTEPIPHSRPWIDRSDIAAVQSVTQSGLVADGQRVACLEESLAKYLDCPAVRVTSSGTQALVIALMALSIAPGDEVILPTYVCQNVMEAVRQVGAQPVLADTSANRTISVSDVEAHQTSRTRAVIAVHTFGYAADVRALNGLGVPVIEDACQSFGLQILGRQAGTLGVMGVYSMHATKCFTAGIGGAVVSGDGGVMDRVTTLLRGADGARPISDIDAALGVSQLERYDSMLSRRSAIASRYLVELADLPIELPGNTNTVFFRFPIRLRKTTVEEAIHRFATDGVVTRRGVDALLHRTAGDSDSRFPQAVRDFNETLSLPIYPSLSDQDQEKIIQSAHKILA